MKYRTSLVVLLALSMPLTAMSTTTITNNPQQDSLFEVVSKRISTLEAEISSMKLSIRNSVDAQRETQNKINFFNRRVDESDKKFEHLADTLQNDLSSTRSFFSENTKSLSHSIQQKSHLVLSVVGILGLLFATTAFFLGKTIAKRKNEIVSLREKADKLNEEIVQRMSGDMSELQKILTQVATISSATSPDNEQNLIKTLADRITFMEMTLYKMDESVRGHKQLTKSIKQMKDNLLANGYEIVDMLGLEYHDGMRITATFVEDENIPEGKQIITGIIKPQINYHGQMIQSAQVTVSQNI